MLGITEELSLDCVYADMQRFQVPYNLKVIPEVQAYLAVAFDDSTHRGDLQDLYRRRCAYRWYVLAVAELTRTSQSAGRTETTNGFHPCYRHAELV